jgi:hypothetical protein
MLQPPDSYPDRRIGCANCDMVTSALNVYPEREIHGWRCPVCEQQTLHHYPVIGSWPSDYDAPPCVPQRKA